MPSNNRGSLVLKTDGRILFAGTKFCDLVGVKYEKIAGMSFYDFVFPQDVDGARNLFDHKDPVRLRIRRLDGTEVWTRIAPAPMEMADGTIIAIKAKFTAASDNR